MEPVVATLLSSFRRVPSAAIPAMIDCILTSTSISPSSLFSSLINHFPHISKEIGDGDEKVEADLRNLVVSYVGVLCQLLKKSGDAFDSMQTFTWKILIPLLKLTYSCDRELFNEIARMFFATVIEGDTWKVVEATIVPFLFRSIGLSLGMQESEEFSIFKWTSSMKSSDYVEQLLGPESPCSVKSINDPGNTSILSQKDYFPLLLSCNLLAMAMGYALQRNCSDESAVLGNNCSAKIFVGNLLWDLSNVLFHMLLNSSDHRASAVRYLLPSILKALASNCEYEVSVQGQTNVISREHLYVKLWNSCRMLSSLGSSERRDAYAILSLYISFFSFIGGLEDGYVASGNGSFDLRNEDDFWDEIRRGLVDKESLVRKQSIHILRTAVYLNEKNQPDSIVSDTTPERETAIPRGMTKRGLWADQEAKSLGVGRQFNHSEPDSPSQRRWEAFILLYEMLEEYGTHLVEAAWNNQMSLLLQSSLQSDKLADSDIFKLYHMRIKTAEQIFEWLAVLWERGFCHDNPQVRWLIMQSFLSIDWENYGDRALLVPSEFILGPFVDGMNDPVHHKDFGVKGVYSSWTIEAVSKFLFHYASCLPKRKHILFLRDLALVAKKKSFGRAGLMCFVDCISSTALGSIGCTDCNDSLEEDAEQNHEVELLEVLRFIIESSKQHFNPHYRYQVCQKIVTTAVAVISIQDLPLEILMNFISSLPWEISDLGGSLRLKLQEWLLVSNKKPNLKLLKSINGFPQDFVEVHHSEDTNVTCNDEDLDAWENQANKWARVLFLVIKEEQDLELVLKFLQDFGHNISKQNSVMRWVPVKYLILACSLLHELQIIQERVIGLSRIGRKKKVNLTDSAGHRYSVGYSIIFEKFAALFSSILAELVSFAKLSCSIFGSTTVTEHGALPGSIKGRLGGPSQRRLSSQTTDMVLQAITSVKSLALILSWSTKFKTDTSFRSAFAFLWDFCWKIITSPTSTSETDAEVTLAAYESLAYALKSLANTFSTLSLELLLIRCSNSTPEVVDCKPALDTLVQTFLLNINKLIAEGSLVRTRLAVLMNWKWMCLESLLSIPKSALHKGVHTSSCQFFYSNTALHQIFSDLDNSIENAGEASVLHILRSVRFVLELFASGQKGCLVSSGDGVNSQMMWRLVRSSWVLHASCNKRRVAPIAALLSSVLHHSVFSNESMHEYENEPGPLKWLVERILEEGTRSPRTIRLSALHLTGLWLSQPKIIKYYIQEIKLLTLYGSVAFDEDFEAELVENQDARLEVSLLAKSPDRELTEEFVNTELYARVSVAALFYQLGEPGDTDKNSDCAFSSGKMFLTELLYSVTHDKDLSKELYKKHSAIHRRKVRVWQMICILARFTDQDNVEEVMLSLHMSLQRNNLPSVRQYLETFAIYVYLKFPSLVGQELVHLLRNYEMRPQALSSYVFIAANIILHTTKASQSRHLEELLPPIIPLLTSHHHTLRGFAQLLVYHILHKLFPFVGTLVTMPLERKCFEDLKHYLTKNPDCARLRASMEGYLDDFDPKLSVSPAGIFSSRIEEAQFECVPTSLMDQVTIFLNDAREDLRSSMANDAIAIKNESIHAVEGQKSEIESVHSTEEHLTPEAMQEMSLDFQKKITFPNHVNEGTRAVFDSGETFRSLMDIETEDQLFYDLLHSRCVAVEKLKGSRQEFIFVASLIDRIPNLAGLVRTCEVFRAAGLAIADKSILKDKQFQLISVTADKWVPIVEVPVGSLKVFLEQKKIEGFSILGLEQTANSISLDQYVFPRKTVLVLGREKEGIPVEIIHMLDACVEIPQLGVVRSLNVHVSGAIALWEYTRQQRSQ
ncbi:hypothetical protein Leryth_000767 [Lithospermum erythrorhizon]|nr:hypothetical protein Leryth_000767 [Lithospermum erythrorhizon]